MKNTNTWRLNIMLLNNQWITEETKEEIKNYLETSEHESKNIQKPWHEMKAALVGKFTAITILPQETRKISNEQPNPAPKAIRERRKSKTQSQ